MLQRISNRFRCTKKSKQSGRHGKNWIKKMIEVSSIVRPTVNPSLVSQIPFQYANKRSCSLDVVVVCNHSDCLSLALFPLSTKQEKKCNKLWLLFCFVLVIVDFIDSRLLSDWFDAETDMIILWGKISQLLLFEWCYKTGSIQLDCVNKQEINVLWVDRQSVNLSVWPIFQREASNKIRKECVFKWFKYTFSDKFIEI